MIVLPLIASIDLATCYLNILVVRVESLHTREVCVCVCLSVIYIYNINICALRY